MKTIILTLWRLVVLALAVLYAVSCKMVISADGSKSFSIDGEQAARAIEILGQK